MAIEEFVQLTGAYSGDAEEYPAPTEFSKRAHVQSLEAYQEKYQRSVEDPDTFWAEEAQRITWFKPFTKVKDASFASSSVSIRWFEGGTTNASYNCLDRHLEERGDHIALIWEQDDPSADARHITYRELHADVCRLANVLKTHGVKKGDLVTVYMPMIPEAAAAMLACSRIGAIHSVVFAGFSPDALADRILDCDSTFVITADEGVRGGRRVPLKHNTDRALERCPDVSTVLIVKRTGGDIGWTPGRDVWYHEAMEDASAVCAPEAMESEDPLFILYTSGSTGKPKGVLHTTGGYLVYTSLTHELVFDYHPGDVFWCTADVGWITGHSYIVYGPLINGATQVFFEGTPTYPDAARFWEVVDRHQVTQFYTAPPPFAL